MNEQGAVCPECETELIWTQEIYEVWGATMCIDFLYCPHCGYMIQCWN